MNTLPDDFDVRYTWREGSVPPPYYYEYRIHLAAPGSAEVTLIPDYPAAGVPQWREIFSVTPSQLETLYRHLLTLGLLSTPWQAAAHPPVGGSSESLTIQAQRRKIEIPFFAAAMQDIRVNETVTAIRALVPQTLWDTLEMRLKLHRQNNSSK
ncbi:MAG: hypothetical protein HY273_10120 [Gammaproteobacteria bacterium]|nr:hypothetical protein [Gammaproteobacteria bacterium]